MFCKIHKIIPSLIFPTMTAASKVMLIAKRKLGEKVPFLEN